MALDRLLAKNARLIVEEFQRETGKRAVITSGYRSLAKQKKLYDAYRRGGPLAAAPGQSAHNYGFAVDIAIVGEPRSSRLYRTLHRIAARYGLTPLQAEQLKLDPYHLQVPNWRALVGRRASAR